ncbi:hypothetical protein R3W88_025785 [Solanum pinnatisectum]|uniref:Uncharacterized protein n=1 Tax=Solanum pinnatisectum TaxID=50273 RepID=A0AAV9M5W8_9SOLN|nr:hypothetical protein R3W88_025785 [Solanum pinnatisectum]
MLFLGFGYFVMVLGVTSYKGVVVMQFFQWHFHGDTDIQFSFLCFCMYFLSLYISVYLSLSFCFLVSDFVCLL